MQEPSPDPNFKVGVTSLGIVDIQIPIEGYCYTLGFTPKSARALASMLVKQAEIAESMVIENSKEIK